MPLKSIPKQARLYILFGAFFITLPSILGMYEGHTGKFLVATGQANGTTFEKTVIYLRHHDFGGAHGVIINKPVTSRDFRKPFPELEWNVDLYEGGPVEYGEANFLLLEAPNNPPFDLINTQTLKEDNPNLFQAFESKENETKHRLYIGYSGWRILQLNREIKRGHWGVIDYDPEIMFETSNEQVWKRAIERVLEERPAATGGI